MQHEICYTKTERFWLAALGVFGFFVVNGAFAYGLLFQPNALTAAWTNPLAAAFMVEALVLVGGIRVPVRAVGGEPARVGLVRVPVAAGQHGLRNPRRAAVPQAGRE